MASALGNTSPTSLDLSSSPSASALTAYATLAGTWRMLTATLVGTCTAIDKHQEESFWS